MKAQMRRGERWVEVGIGNVSATGLLVKFPTPPPVGASVEIARRSVHVTGRVVWTSGVRFGVHSSEPIDVEALLSESTIAAPARRLAAREAPRLWHWRTRRE